MSGLAVIARELGASVSGSDRAEGRYIGRLRERGIDPAIGHDARNVPDGAEVVYSSAVGPDNPERVRAAELELRELRRGELLGEVTRLRRCIAVAGSHGKTTTAAMTVHAMRGAGMRPSYAIGAEWLATGSNVEWTGDEWLVVETDESDRSFLALDPDVAVITNVELEHHRNYASRREFADAFRDFAALAPSAVIWDRPETLGLRNGPVVPFDARDVELDRTGSRFEWRGREVRLPVPGAHNARNAAAALEAARLAGADEARAAATLEDFRGAVRRFEPVGRTSTGAELYDDYGHHPTEVRATLDGARSLKPARLVAVLQPHQYIRVQIMGREFGEALARADVAVVLDILATRGSPADYPGVTGKRVARAAADAGGGRTVVWTPDAAAAERFLRSHLREGDLCVTMGADPIGELARRLASEA